MKTLFLFCLLLTGRNCFAQSEVRTSIYNDTGALYVAPKFTIPATGLEHWRNCEPDIFASLIDKIGYPQQYKALGIQGISILSYKCMSPTKISEMKIVKSIGSGFDQSIIEGISRNEEVLCTCLFDDSMHVTYYLPILFALEDAIELKYAPIIRVK